MEGAGGQSKRANMPQVSPWQRCSSSPFKAVFEKRRLSLRSQNATQTGSLSSRQPIASVQKQSGKENELPFDQNIGEKKTVTFAKSESRKKKSSIPGVCADSAKRILKRRLSGEYRDHLSSNKLYRGEIEPVNRPMKVGADFPLTANDNRQKISVYDDGGNENNECGMKGLLFSTGSAKQRFGVPELDRRLKKHDKDVEDAKEPDERWLQRVDPASEIHAAIEAPEAKPHRDSFPPDDTVEKLSGAGEKLVTSKSQLAEKATQSRDSSMENKRTFDGSNFANELSDAEFRIERVDCKDSMTPAIHNLRKFKSGSSIGRLKVTIRRGEEISPLKRRLNQYKKSVLNLRNSVDFRPGLTAALKSSGMGLNSVEEVKKLSKKRSDCELKSMLHPSEVESMDETSSEMLIEQKTNRESLNQGKKSHRRRLSEPSVMCIGTIIADPPVSEDRHNLSPGGVDRESQIGISSSQHSVITLSSSSPIAESNCTSRFDAEAKETASCQRDMSLWEKWDAVVAEFKNKFKPRPQVEKNSIRAVVSNETVELATPGRTPVLYLQMSVTSHLKRLAKCETNRKLSKSATHSHTQKGIEAQLDRATAIAVEDEPESSAQDANIDQCARTTFENLKTLRKIQPRDLTTMNYEEEIIKFEYARERRAHQVSKTFLKGKTVLPEQRRIVVNFLIGVHTYLSTSSSTLYQATKIFDAILDLKDVSMKELQLVALGASWIAIKNIDTNIPSAREMISFAKDMYTPGGSRLLCKCEQKILKTLNFNLRFSDPFYMLSYYIDQGLALGILPGQPSTRKIYHCAHYIVNTALLDERYSGSSARLLAAAAAQTAVNLVLEASESRAKWFQWRNEKITGYTQEKINRFVAPLLVGILESAEENSPTNAVYKKYKSSRYENISNYLITKIKSQLSFP